MTEDLARDEAFWKLIGALDSAGVPGQLDELARSIDRLPEERATRVREVAASNGIDLPG